MTTNTTGHFIFSAVIGNLALNPLNVIKTRYIFHRGKVPYNQLYNQLNEEGIQGFYSGVIPGIGINFIQLMLNIPIRDYILSLIDDNEEEEKLESLEDLSVQKIENTQYRTTDPMKKLIANSISNGLSSSIVSCLTLPLNIARIGLELDNKGKYMNAYDVLQDLVKRDGYKIFIASLLPNFLSHFVYSSVKYFIWDYLKGWILKLQSLEAQKLSNRHEAFINQFYIFRQPRIKVFSLIIFISTFIGFGVSMPFETLRTLLQIDMITGKNEYNGSIIKLSSKIIKNEGIKGFYHGLLPGALHISIQSCLAYIISIIPEYLKTC